MMTRLFTFGIVALAAIASASDGKLMLSRAYKADQTAVYSVQIDQTLGMAHTTLTLTEHVTKVESDGGADIELLAGQITNTINGVSSDPRDGKPFTARFDKTGAVVSAQSGLMSAPFLVGGAYVPEGGFAVGQMAKFDQKDPGADDVRIRGTAKLVSVTDDVATVSLTADRLDVKNGPISHVEGTFTYKVKDSTLMKSDVWISQTKRPHSGKTHIVSELQGP